MRQLQSSRGWWRLSAFGPTYTSQSRLQLGRRLVQMHLRARHALEEHSMALILSEPIDSLLTGRQLVIQIVE